MTRTNPNNSFGSNAGYSGRTSVNAFNDNLAAYNGRGIVSGWQCAPNTGMSVVLGGNGNTRDVAIAEDNSGNRITINNINESPIAVSIAAAPASNSRVDAIVVYVVNPPVSTSSIQDNYDTIGVLDVQGTTSSNPLPPSDGDIRAAITADGESGATAYYVVLANITIGTGTTDITSDMITAGQEAYLSNVAPVDTSNIVDGAITTAKINDGAITNAKLSSSVVKNTNIDWTTMGGTDYFSQITWSTTVGASNITGYWVKFDNNLVVFLLDLDVSSLTTSGAILTTNFPSDIRPGRDFFIPGWIKWQSGINDLCAVRYRNGDDQKDLQLVPAQSQNASRTYTITGSYIAGK